MTNQARGSFEVKLKPQETEDQMLGRMSIEKVFRGDLEAASRGEMLTGMTGLKGSAGYVAIEKVSGTLQGRTGTFILQHSGTMTRGEPQLSVTVVPDSGTDELAGLRGKMEIKIEAGNHLYELEYEL